MKVKTALSRSTFKIRKSGAVAVEAAIILPIVILALTIPIYYARCFWYYTVAQKAAQDAARYLSKVPAAEMRTSTFSGSAARTAVNIVQKELSELSPGPAIAAPIVECNGLPCGTQVGTAPSTVRVYIGFSVIDDIFGAVSFGRFGIMVKADVTLPYVGT